ncbi:MAG: hypothetical protein QNJ15_11055 [Erythrobacter sp.]|nr:hypothetical protein [Erythrobacter sp.]
MYAFLAKHALEAEFRMLALEELTTDWSYQRPVSEENVARKIALMSETDSRFLGLAAQRNNGRQLIVDGQHHVTAARRMGVVELPFAVIRSPGSNFERDVFRRWQEDQQARLRRARSLPGITDREPRIA